MEPRMNADARGYELSFAQVRSRCRPLRSLCLCGKAVSSWPRVRAGHSSGTRKIPRGKNQGRIGGLTRAHRRAQNRSKPPLRCPAGVRRGAPGGAARAQARTLHNDAAEQAADNGGEGDEPTRDSEGDGRRGSGAGGSRAQPCSCRNNSYHCSYCHSARSLCEGHWRDIQRKRRHRACFALRSVRPSQPKLLLRRSRRLRRPRRRGTERTEKGVNRTTDYTDVTDEGGMRERRAADVRGCTRIRKGA